MVRAHQILQSDYIGITGPDAQAAAVLAANALDLIANQPKTNSTAAGQLSKAALRQPCSSHRDVSHAIQPLSS